MGLTPVEGLIMGTRSGDIDPGILLLLCKKNLLIFRLRILLLINIAECLELLEFHLICVKLGSSKKNNERAILGLKMYHYRIRKYIGAYAAAMGGVDTIVFTGGVGENSAETRAEVCKDFEFLGIDFDENANKGYKRQRIRNY